jgi:hypothetical protein
MSDTDGSESIVGKKVFFLCPTVVVQNRIISELVQQEFEVYIAKDKDKLKRVLTKYPDSIVLVDINEVMPENEWDVWITGLMEAPDTKSVSVGIMTPNDDEQIKRKYLQTIKVTCSYTVLGYDLDKAIAQIIAVLQTAGAKGRRKYIRAIIDRGETNATINMPLNGAFINGQIRDISVVGISCTLGGNPAISKNALCKDIQLRLQTNLLKVEGIFFGSRIENEETIYVILFTQRINPDVRTKIRKYIQHNLQSKMDFHLGQS